MTYWQAYFLSHRLSAAWGNSEGIIFSTTDAGILLKTKDRRGKLGVEGGMCLKTPVG
jgi:hypothetical protein